MIKYSLVIPFYNEEKNIDKVINILIQIKKIKTIEFILVNNGSTDNSEKIFKRKFNKLNKKYLNNKINKNIGYGYGIKWFK